MWDKLFPLNEVLNVIFQTESTHLRNAYVNACENLRSPVDRAGECSRKFLSLAMESLPRTEVTRWAGEAADLMHPLAEAMANLIASLIRAARTFSRRSFEAAFLVAKKLQELQSEKRGIRFYVDGLERTRRVHTTWAVLAEKGCCLIPRLEDFDEKAPKLVDALKELAEEPKGSPATYTTLPLVTRCIERTCRSSFTAN